MKVASVRSRSRYVRRSGYTLLELVAANFIVAATLVPATVLIRDGVAYTRRVERRNDMKTFCVSKLEQHSAQATNNFVEVKESGNFKDLGMPDLAYQVTRTIPGIKAGLPTGLMEISVWVWEDRDADGRLGLQEPFVDMHTRLAQP